MARASKSKVQVQKFDPDIKAAEQSGDESDFIAMQQNTHCSVRAAADACGISWPEQATVLVRQFCVDHDGHEPFCSKFKQDRATAGCGCNPGKWA